MKQHNKVLETDSVLSFVHWLKKPALVRAEEIELIKRFLNGHIKVKFERIAVSINDLVKIIIGPFMELEAKVMEVNNKNGESIDSISRLRFYRSGKSVTEI